MKCNTLRRVLALCLAAALCAALLVGCGSSGEEEEIKKTHEIVAEPGGSAPPFSEGFDTTRRYVTETVGDTLCIAFNGIQDNGRHKVPYFTAAGDTITLTASATAESEYNKTFRALVWKQVEGGTQYVGTEEQPGTVEFTADGELYTAQISGLEPGAEYKVTLAYDGRGKYYMSGQLSVQGIAAAAEEQAAA